MIIGNNLTISGLTTEEVQARQGRFGKNVLASKRRNHLLESLLHIVREPMFILLAVACVLYFFLGDLTEAMMMLVSILFVAGIEIFQETKSEKALELLRDYTRAQVRVLRDGAWTDLPSEELVPDDIVSIGEGERVPADGVLLQQNDLSVEEAVLTGESLPVGKGVVEVAPPLKMGVTAVETEFSYTPEPKSVLGSDEAGSTLFQGTTIAAGQGIFQVTATGARTELGKLGKSIESIEAAPTPLQRQIERFVRGMGIIGGAAFVVVLLLNLWLENDIWKALLFSLTIAMALIPEEIPVAFSSFMALGAYRMIRSGILAKQPKTVESLGSATVICLDKTGTITENRMSVAETTDFFPENDDASPDRVLEFAWWASEPEPLDAMERAIQKQVLADGKPDLRADFFLKKEYALGGVPPMMTHVWENRRTGEQIIAAKGAVERMLRVSGVGEDLSEKVLDRTEAAAAKGYRVLGVASAKFEIGNSEIGNSGGGVASAKLEIGNSEIGNSGGGGASAKLEIGNSEIGNSEIGNSGGGGGAVWPENQDDFDWQFRGIIAFYDPPKPNAGAVFQQFYEAGLRVLMITGDHTSTAKNIAREVGLQGWEVTMTGEEVMTLDENALRDAAGRVNIFARMFPDAKLRVVNALKANGETVAMSGDGVNDGPALKAAQIGVAMGKKGADIAKSAASLVLLRDDLSALVTAIGMGRRIYDNLRKAIRYIISIHLPIVLTVLVPLLFGWQYPHILLPLHVIFLELVMDPVAAVAFENEPAEPNILRKKPRLGTASLFSWSEVAFSVLQGLALGAGVLYAYYFSMQKGLPEAEVRSFVFTTMVFANLFLTLANRSFDYPITRTIFYKNLTLPMILGVSLLMLAAVLYLPFVTNLFKMTPLSVGDVGWCAGVAMLSVGWFEVWKAVKPK